MSQHDFIRDEFGVDVFRLDIGFHNGPECAKCHVKFCHHCYPDRYAEQCYAPEVSA